MEILNGELPEVGSEEHRSALGGSKANGEEYDDVDLDPTLKAYQSGDKSKLEYLHANLACHTSRPKSCKPTCLCLCI